MKRICLLLILLSFFLTGCVSISINSTEPSDVTTPATSTSAPIAETTPKPVVGWITEGDTISYIKEDGSKHTGWLEAEGSRYYFNEAGILQTGWLDLNGSRYYLNEAGILQTGWLELDGKQYYLKEDGSITRGKATIDQQTHYFTSQGVETIVVNPWNVMPSDYIPELVDIGKGHKVDVVCKDALMQMLADCRAAGYDPAICSSFREHSTQIELYTNKVNYYLSLGYEYDAARSKAGQVVAVPGTSEHELGLALDLVDNGNWDLNETQENTPAQKWLMEHCWEYGFILRYPTAKTEYTGIIYEPWHYRYVGVELALELRASGMCLEEYFDALS